MKYFYGYEIQYQEVDLNRRLRLFTLENYLLNTAGRVADSLGFGIKYLHQQNLTWVLTRMSIEMNYLPTSCEKVVFETWIESNAHMLSTRDFRIYLLPEDIPADITAESLAAAGAKLIGRAKSVWAILDLTEREIVNIFHQDVFEGAVDGEVLDMPRAARLLPITEPDDIVEHKIQYSDVDYNKHCNSCKYLEMMLNAKLPDLENRRFRLDINYVKEVYLGDCLFTHYVTDAANDEDIKSVQYAQKDINGTTCCSAKISIGGFED